MINANKFNANDYPQVDPDLREAGWRLHHEAYFDDMESLRAISAPSDQVALPEDEAIDVEEVWISGPDGQDLAVIIYRAKEVAGGHLPGLLWFHGGGYAMGNPRMDLWFLKPFILGAGMVVCAPDYRRSTQAPYPAALEDAYASLLWMADKAHELGIDKRQLMIGGRSAGGGLAIATALYSRDHQGPDLAFQMPLYPMLDDRLSTESMQGNESFCWNEARNRLAWQLYLGQDFGSERVSKYAAPYRELDLAGLPPAYTYVGDQDPFYSETLAYVSRLRASGVEAELDLYPGAFHGFDGVDAPLAHQARHRCLQALKVAIQTYVSPKKEVGHETY